MKTSLSILTFVFALAFTNVIFSQTTPDPNKTEEFRMRSGLPNFFSKVNNGETINVGFIGGSITAGGDEKWSGKVFNWMQTQYPSATFVRHNVAVPGTSADFGAFRIGSQMLVHNPDLVFIEYRVNGLGRQGYKGPEGMVRQILRNNPNTDICFVYTISQGMVDTVRNGNQTSVGKVIEEVANLYDVPSIDMGIEVVKLLDEDKLVFKSSVDVPGKIRFTTDGTHPLEAGAEIYKDVVVRNLLKMESNTTPLARTLPDLLDEQSFQNGIIHTINEITNKSANWTMMDPNTDAIYRTARWRSVFVLGDAFKTAQVGETISFDWEGYALVMTTIPQGDGITIDVVTDGAPAQEYSFTQSGSRFGTEFFYTPFITNGNHTTTITVKALPNGSSFYFGQYYTSKTVESDLSVDDVLQKEAFVLYPNPATEKLIIDSSLLGNNYSIVSLTGEEVIRGLLDSDTINVGQLTSGVYFLKINEVVKRFVKK